SGQSLPRGDALGVDRRWPRADGRRAGRRVPADAPARGFPGPRPDAGAAQFRARTPQFRAYAPPPPPPGPPAAATAAPQARGLAGGLARGPAHRTGPAPPVAA